MKFKMLIHTQGQYSSFVLLCFPFMFVSFRFLLLSFPITISRWGVDYLKYDNCDTPDSPPDRVRYANMSAALNASGYSIAFLSIPFTQCIQYLCRAGDSLLSMYWNAIDFHMGSRHCEQLAYNLWYFFFLVSHFNSLSPFC